MLLVLQIPLTLLRGVKVTCNGGKSYKSMNFSFLYFGLVFFPFSHLYVSVRIFPCYSQALSIHFSYCASFSSNWCETRGYWFITAEFCSRRNAAVTCLRIQYLNLGNFHLVLQLLEVSCLVEIICWSVYHCSKTERQYLTGLASF